MSRVLTLWQMKYPAAFLVASLFFHTSSSSSQGTKSNGLLQITGEQRIENAKLAIALSQVFNYEGLEVVSTNMSHSDPFTVPFTFPTSTSYDMDLSRELSKKCGTTPQRVFSILIQITCALLHFHIKRLFKLDPLEPFIPIPNENAGIKWEDNPQDWFTILLNAIMPGATIDVHEFAEPVEINRVYAKPFQFLAKGSNFVEYSTHRNGIPKTHLSKWSNEAPTVLIYLPPAHFLGKRLKTDQPIFCTLCLERSYPPCKQILDHLLQGITFAFELNHSELGISVIPTKNISSVRKSKYLLKKLFTNPIGTQIMVPVSIESAFQESSIPKISCYHPTRVSFTSPKLYEQMLILMIAGSILAGLQNTPYASVSNIVRSLRLEISQFFPHSSVETRTNEVGEPGRKVCVYDPKTFGMLIYKGVIDDRAIEISLKLGEPVMLNHIQMVTLTPTVFPSLWTIPVMEEADTPAKQIFMAIITRLKEFMKTEQHTTSVTPSSDKENKATVLEQSGKPTFNSDGFQEAASNTLLTFSKTAPDSIFYQGIRIPRTNILYLLDKLSRNYARNTASKYENAKTRTKVYQQSRRTSLSNLFEGKVLVVFNADKLPLVKDALYNLKIFSPLHNEGGNVKRDHYVSWYMESVIAGEGTELVCLLSTPITPTSNPSPFVEHLNNPVFQDYPMDKITCKYPASGDLSEFKGQLNLKFDADRRIVFPWETFGRPDWPLRLNVMVSVLEAIRVAGVKFLDNLGHNTSLGPTFRLTAGYATEIVSYAPHLRQFDLIDTSKPIMYIRKVEKLPAGVTFPIIPVYWEKPNCYLLGVRPADTIIQNDTSLIWTLKINFHKAFEVNGLTLKWFHEHRHELTSTAIYRMIEKYGLS